MFYSIRGRRTALILLSLLAVVALPDRLTRLGHAAGPCSIPNFSGPSNITLTAPRALVVDDFNKDGKLDVAAANNRSSGTISILLGNGTGGFSAPTTLTGARNPTFLASGDLNNDSNPDLVVANENNFEGEIGVFLGNGSGGFGPRIQIRLFPFMQNIITSVAVGDINGDNKPDLALTSFSFNAVSLLQGDGTGHFTILGSFTAGGSPGYVAMKDLNGDAKLDLAVANSGSSVAVYLGDGAGHFGAATTFAVGSNPDSIAVGDLNGDSKLDLAVANSGSNNISILLGDGLGNFGTATNFSAAGSFPQSIVQGDFNGDGKVDLALTNILPGSVEIFSGNGTGSFTEVANFNDGGTGVSFGTSMAAVADFNGDSRPDLVVANEGAGVVGVLLNSCGTTTATTIQLNSISAGGPESGFMGANGSAQLTVTRTGDITGSADVDYATADGTATAPQDYTAVAGTLHFAPGEIFKTITVTIINDNLTENFNENFNFTISNVVGGAILGSPSTNQVFIFDDDLPPTISINDVTVTEGDSGTANAHFTVSLNHPSAFAITVNYATADVSATAGADYQAAAGTLTFNPGVTSRNITVPIAGDVLAEVNETYFVNLSSPTNATLAVAQGLGTIADDDSTCPGPSFGAVTEFTVGSNPNDLVAADFNGDGKNDLAVTNQTSNNVSILLGNASGGFGTATNFAVGGSPKTIATADFNLDNKVDLVTANYDPSGGINNISLLLGDGAGGFAAATNTNPVSNIRFLAAADFNVDGKPDLAVLSTTEFIGPSSVAILMGNGAGGFGSPTSYAAGTSALFITFAAINADGKPDLITANFQGNDISVLMNNGDGTFAPAVNFAAGFAPQSIGTGDVNGDGKLDLVVTGSASSGNVRTLIGNGLGSFVLTNSMTVGLNPYRVNLADLNGDGKLDLAITDPAPGNDSSLSGVWVSFGNGAGSFGSPTRYASGSTALAVLSGDFNSDGKLDLVVTNFQSTKISLVLNTCSATLPTVVRFSNSIYQAGEGDISALITVIRSGNTSGTTSVDFTSSDGSASQATDYVVASGTVNFAAGETSKAFEVLIVDDVFIEGDETLNLNLSNAIGATLGSPAAATLTIVNNDTSNASTPRPTQFVADLTGAKEVPPNNSPAKGGGVFLLDASETSAKASLIFSGLTSSELIARIHGPAGPNTNAPIIFQLPQGTPVVNFPITPAPSPQNVADLKAGLLYMNVHSMGFTNGEIRGELLWNPVEEADFFVRQVYFDFLSRAPDPSGLAFWTNEITQCQSDVQCLRNKRVDVSNAFYFELEFQQSGAFVYRLYRVAYGNNQPFSNPNPDPGFPNEEKKLPSYAVFVADRARVVGGQSLAQAQLALANAFVQRPEFLTKYPASLATADQFVDAVLATLQNDLGVNLATERASLISLYNTQGGRGAVVYRLADDSASNPINNQSLVTAEYNRAFVATQYFGYLRRDPDIPGFRFWLDQVNGAPLRDVPRQHAMVCSFITSGEFQFRFGPVASRNNNECPQ